jgi:hypothetical protein
MVKNKKNRMDDEITRIFNDPDVVTHAIQAGIYAALLRHKQMGNPICVWRDGKVVWIEPEDIQPRKQ